MSPRPGQIVWLSHFVPYPPTSGALERSYHLLCFAARCRAVHLLALDQPRLRGSAVTVAESVAALQRICASVQVFAMPFERSGLMRGVVRTLSVPTGVPYDRIWLHSRELHAAARALAARAAVELVHVDTLGLMSYARHFRGVPVVLNHHNVESVLVARRASGEASWWRVVLLRREARKLRHAERTVCPSVAVNTVVSKLDEERLLEAAPGSRVLVVGNGVDTAYFAPGADPGPEGGLIFVGTLGWYANREAARILVTRIWPALNADGRCRRLTLVGRDPQWGDWGNAAAEGVTATGYVRDIRPYMHRSCIVVCPIQEGGGTRLKVLVALAMAKPLVATQAAVEGLSLVENEHYLRAESVEAFVAQIRRLEDDIRLRRRLGEAGRALVQHEYDWSVVGVQLDSAYADAAARGTAQW